MWLILEGMPNLPIVISLLICGISFYFWFKRPCSNFPPGPRGIPFLGCIPFLGLTPEAKFLEYAKTYGGIFSVRIGMKEWVVLNDSEAIHEVLLTHGAYTSGRPPSLLGELSGYLGIGFLQYDEIYKIQKHFGASTLRGFGVGKKSMEDRIIREVKYLCEAIRTNNKKAFNIKNIISKAICNNVAGIVFGSRFEYDDPMFIEIIRIISLTMSAPDTITLFKIVTLVPMLENVPPFRGHIQNLFREIKKEIALFKQLLEEHKKTFDKNNLRDFTDAFIAKMREENAHSSFTDLQLLQYIREIFLAGTETSTGTLLWGFLCLLHYPEAEKKIYKEIVDVVGSDGVVTYSKRKDMPYTSAFIEELYRYRTIAPTSLSHKTSADITIGKLHIPKETWILPNQWGVHNNPKHWNEPQKFIPERHLNEKGEFVKSKNVIPFGVGPRTCIGEQLARTEIFIYFVTLIQKFRFEPDPTENELPNIDKFFQGLVFVPLPYKVVAKEK